MLCLAAAALFSSTSHAEEDGAFCTAKGYLAYQLRSVSPYGVPRHVLRVVRFEAARGIYQSGEVTLNAFHVHGLTCSPDRVEISGWGSGFEQYTIGVAVAPPTSSGVTNSALGASVPHPLPILAHHSNPAAKFDPAKDSPEPRWLWHEPIGSYPLESADDHQYFLVISGSDKSAKSEIKHGRTAALTEKDQRGTVLDRLQLYQNVDVETID
jgi:hypothetical protein